MSKQALQFRDGRMAMSFVAHIFQFVIIPVNPPNIVQIKNDEFSIDLNNMEARQPYFMDFLGSLYLIWKNQEEPW